MKECLGRLRTGRELESDISMAAGPSKRRARDSGSAFSPDPGKESKMWNATSNSGNFIIGGALGAQNSPNPSSQITDKKTEAQGGHQGYI